MKFPTTPILAAALALAATLLLASAAPAAENAVLAVGGPTTPILDNFNRADESPLSGGGNWAKVGAPCAPLGGGGSLRIVSERVTVSAGAIGGHSYWTPSFNADQEAYARIDGVLPTATNEGEYSVYARLTDPGVAGGSDGYAFQLAPVTWRLIEFTNGVCTTLASGPSSVFAVGDYMWLRCEGTTIAGYVTDLIDATQLFSVNDSAHNNAGNIGIRVRTGSMFWDDFGGGAIAGPPPPPPGPPPPAQSYGTDENGKGWHGWSGTKTVSEPVNTFTGAFTTTVEDLALPGTGVSFAWSRSYTSADPTVGRLGPGWTDSYSASLLIQGNGDVLLHGEDGQQLYYTKQGDGSFVGASGSLSTLSSVAGGYKLVRSDQVTYLFDAQGKVTSIKDRNAQGLTLAYDGSGRLATITDAAGRQATVTYNASNLVSQVSTQDGRSVSYGYAGGLLTSAIDVRGKTWTSTYDASGRLATIVDPLDHTQVTNVYGADGRVSSQTDAVGKTTTFAWDPVTQLATVTDANQKVWKDDYASNILQKRIDPLLNETEFVHDADLNTTSVESPTNEATTMTYDAAGNLLTATAPPSLGSAQKTFLYNAKNDPTQITDARSKVTSYTYDASGNTQTVTQDLIQVGAYTYDPAGRVLTFTDGNEKTWTYTYFPATGYLESVTDPLQNKTTYTYDAAGRVLTRVDPKGNCAGCTPADFTWSYAYDAAGQQLTETDPLGHVTTNVYDDAGRLTSSTDANQHTTSYTYDDADRVLTETAPDPDGAGPLTAPVTTYTYDNVGNKLTETAPDPDGGGPLSAPVTTFAYDSANRLVSTTGPDPDGAGPQTAPVTTQTYDANGNLASTVEPRGNVAGCNCAADYTTSYTYDAAGRLLTETRPDPDGAGPQVAPVTTNTYDPVGNLQSVRDGNNHTTSYSYDAAGRILTVTAPDLGVTTYTYDDAGNVLTRRDDNNHTTTSSYDDAGRLVSETGPDPDGAGSQTAPVTSYTYDPNGNRLTLTDPNGNATPTPGDGQTTYAYDRANRRTSINYSDATPDVTFTHDNVGNRLTMADGSGTETRTYDNLDRLLSVTRGTNTFSYVYDAASNLTRRTQPGGTVADYGYDPLNRLSSVASGGQTTSYAYDVASNLTQTTLPAGNGYLETRIYDRAGRLTEVNNQKGATVLSHFVATLDPVGNPSQVVRSGSLAQTQTYTYDLNDRLLSVCFQAGTCPGANDPFIRWSYDKVGNRLSEQRPGAATTTYSYDFRDRLTSAGSTSYTYDQNGNELSAGSRTFSYDLANRLKTTTQGSTTTTYSYDGDGVRLQASTGTQANKRTNFLWDVNDGLPQVALERDGNNALLRRYVYGVRRISMISGSNTSYYIADGLGSVANLTSSSGATQWTWSYEPFGTIRTETKASGNQPTNFLKFTGEYLDPTGLYHLRARQYDAATGRFTSPDPVTPERNQPQAAGYIYAADRPTTVVDPSGETFTPANDGKVAAYLPTSPVAEFGYEDVAAVPPGPAGRRRIAFTFQYFMDKGLKFFQSAGLVGNFLHETGGTLDPRTKQQPLVPGGPFGPGRGIAQWEIGGRWDELLTFAGKEKVSPWALSTQVQFVWRELNTTYSGALGHLRRTRTVRAATYVVMDEYEQPSKRAFESRLAWAKYVLANYG